LEKLECPPVVPLFPRFHNLAEQNFCFLDSCHHLADFSADGLFVNVVCLGFFCVVFWIFYSKHGVPPFPTYGRRTEGPASPFFLPFKTPLPPTPTPTPSPPLSHVRPKKMSHLFFSDTFPFKCTLSTPAMSFGPVF